MTGDLVHKKLTVVNGKKATGVDKIPPKLLKAGAAQLSEPLATLFCHTSSVSMYGEKG